MICLKYERWGWQCVEWQMSRVDIHLLQYALFFSWPSQKTNNLLVDSFLGFSGNWSSKLGLAVVHSWLWACNFAFVCFYLEASDCFGSLPDCPITCLWADNLSQLFTLVRRSLQTSPFATLCMVSQVKQAQLIVVGELHENSHHTENT